MTGKCISVRTTLLLGIIILVFGLYLLQRIWEQNETIRSLGFEKKLRDKKGSIVHDFKYLLINRNVCDVNLGRPILIFMAIISVTKNVEFRNTIRQTWISSFGNNTGSVRYSFVLANSYSHDNVDIVEESERHKDIIMGDFIDSYQNLTYKTIMSLKFFSSFCSHVQYIMKVDEDMWVNVDNIKHLLKTLTPKTKLTNIIGGKCPANASVIRNRGNKYFMSYKEYPNSVYPPYCRGTYIMSSNVAVNIYNMFQYVPFFRFEDIYTGLCARKLGYSVANLMKFKIGGTIKHMCDYKLKTISVYHRVDPEKMVKIWLTNCPE